MNKLTAIQANRYLELRAICREHREAGRKFWEAIGPIKEEKLYLYEYETWEEFCRLELQLTPQWTNKLIAAKEAGIDIGNGVGKKVQNINKTLTGGSKSETSFTFQTPDSEPKTTPKTTPENTPEPPPAVDAFGREIPTEILPMWERAVEMAKELKNYAQQIKLAVERGLADRDPIFAEITNPTVSEAVSLRYTLGQIAPYVVCPQCQGKIPKSCQMCKRRGWVSKFYYDSPAVDSTLKSMLEKGKK
jgi:hypothetical protein